MLVFLISFSFLFTTGITASASKTYALTHYESLFPVYINGKFEYMDKTGEIVTNYSLDAARAFSNGAAIVIKNGKYGAIDLTGKIIVPMLYNSLGDFSCGRSLLTNDNGLKGYIDKTGKIVIECKYIEADDFSEGVALVTIKNPTDSRYAERYINTNDEFSFDLNMYAYNPGPAKNGVIRIYGSFYDFHGEFLFGDWFDRGLFLGSSPCDFSEELCAYNIIKKEYRDTEKYTEDEWRDIFLDIDFYFNGGESKWEYVYRNMKNEQAFEASFDYAESFNEGMAIAEKDGKRGCINKTGEFVFYNENIYGTFSEGFIITSYSNPNTGDNRYGFLNRHGYVEIPFRYDKVLRNFRYGSALVEIGGKLAYIDYGGDIVLKFDIPPEDLLRHFDY
jgi:hypothetical protein